MSYVKKKGDNLILNNGFHDANFVKKVNGKKRLPQKKFFIFKDEKIVRINNPSNDHIHILETHDNSNRRKNSLLVIYLDLYNRLSFIIIKPNHNYSLIEIIDKAESTPAQRLISFNFLNAQYILGVIRFRYANMENVNIALGYDKSLNYKFSYIFNEKLRIKNAEKTNNLSLLTHIGFTRIPKKDLLNKYIKSSEINLPVYIKSKNKNNLEYFYPLKFNYRHKYNKTHFIYSSISHRLNKNIEYFLRKSVSGQLVFVITDHLRMSIKIKERIGKLFSLFGKAEKYDIYFEKFSKNSNTFVPSFSYVLLTSVRADSAVPCVADARHAPDATVASTSTIPTSRARRPVARAGVVLPLSAVINAGIQPQSRPQRAASCSAGRVKVRT